MAYANGRGGRMDDSLLTTGSIISLVVLAVAILGPVPIGLAVYIAAVVMGVCWKKPEALALGTQAERTATRIKTLKRNLIRLRGGTLGFGDPGTATGRERTKTRERISAWGAVLSGFVFASIDIALGISLPNHPPGVAVFSLFFGFIVGQSVAATVRELAHPVNPGEQPVVTPAVLVDKATAKEFLGDKRNLGIVAAAAALPTVALGAAFLFAGLPPIIAAWFAVLSGACGGLYAFHNQYAKEHLREWRDELATAARWDSIWMDVPRISSPPAWVVDHHLPPDNPTHTSSTFGIRNGSEFTVFADAAARIQPSLNTDMVLISPLPELDENGRVIPGSRNHSGFTVTYSTQPFGSKPHLRNNLDPHTQKFVVRHAVTNACLALNLGRPELAAVRTHATPGSRGVLVESQWKLDPSVTFEKFAAKAQAIQEKLEAPWMRIGRRTGLDGKPSEFVSIIFGHEPHEVEMRPREARALLEWIDQLDWSAWCRAAKIVGTDGQPPHLLSKFVNTRGISEMVFTVPAGFAVADLKRQVPALRATSGHAFIAIETLDDSGLFRMVAGKEDPLAKLYLFADHPEILTPPVEGRPKLEWAVGPGADGELMIYDWDNELPHLLIASGSGMGKSSILNSMILQMAHNSSPKDLQFRFVEPKNELGQFAGFEHCTHFVDMQTPGNPIENVTGLYRELRTEMDRRYALMTKHGVLKLSEARYRASLEPTDDGSPHELDLPYIVCVMEECATFLGAKQLKSDRERHDELMIHVTELARKARAAGIYLVFVTQHPKDENIPTTIKANCRRLGLGVSTNSASMVVIDEPGLEEINTPGRGLVTYGKGYREFRGLYLRAPDEKHPEEPDDRRSVMTRIPHIEDRVFSSAGRDIPTSLLPPPEDIWDTDD